MTLALIVLAAATVAASSRLMVLRTQLRALQHQVVTDPLTGAFNRRQLDVALAAGVAELAIEHGVRAWIDEADAALYRAKRAGRNRVAGRLGGAREHASGPVPVAVRIS